MRFAAFPASVRPRTVRLILSATALFAALAPFNAPAAAPVSARPAGQDEVASYYRPEVRLRKLHLVRPDLIPYPLAYDVYC